MHLAKQITATGCVVQTDSRLDLCACKVQLHHGQRALTYLPGGGHHVLDDVCTEKEAQVVGVRAEWRERACAVDGSGDELGERAAGTSAEIELRPLCNSDGSDWRHQHEGQHAWKAGGGPW